jgi:hypothetical protein
MIAARKAVSFGKRRRLPLYSPPARHAKAARRHIWYMHHVAGCSLPKPELQRIVFGWVGATYNP